MVGKGGGKVRRGERGKREVRTNREASEGWERIRSERDERRKEELIINTESTKEG